MAAVLGPARPSVAATLGPGGADYGGTIDGMTGLDYKLTRLKDSAG